MKDFINNYKPAFLYTCVAVIIFHVIIPLILSFLVVFQKDVFDLSDIFPFLTSYIFLVPLSSFIVFIPLFFIRVLLDKIKIISNWINHLCTAVYILFLCIIHIVNISMFYEYGEPINLTIMYLFDGDANTIFVFLNKQYNIVLISCIIYALTYIGSFFSECLTKKIHSYLSLKTIGFSSLILATLAIIGCFKINKHHPEHKGLALLAPDALISIYRTYMLYNNYSTKSHLLYPT